MATTDKFDKLYDHERELQLKRDAAPELYEALERAQNLIEYLMVSGGTAPLNGPSAMLKIGSALAKARGESISA